MSKQTLDPMIFESLAPIEVPVTIAGESYVLREASGDAGTRYTNALMRSTKMVDGKVVGTDGLADAEPLLVSLCMFKLNELGRATPVQLQVVRGWPYRVVKQLHDRIKEITPELEGRETKETVTQKIKDLQTRLDEMDKAEQNGKDSDHLKNLPEAMTDGSA